MQPEFERIVLPFVRNLERMGITARVRTVDASQYQKRMDTFDYDMAVVVVRPVAVARQRAARLLGLEGRRRGGQPQPARDQEPGHRRAGRGGHQGAGPRSSRRPHPRARPGAAMGLLRDPALSHRRVARRLLGQVPPPARSRRNTASASIPGGLTRRRSRRSRPRRARCRRARRSRPPFFDPGRISGHAALAGLHELDAVLCCFLC